MWLREFQNISCFVILNKWILNSMSKPDSHIMKWRKRKELQLFHISIESSTTKIQLNFVNWIVKFCWFCIDVFVIPLFVSRRFSKMRRQHDLWAKVKRKTCRSYCPRHYLNFDSIIFIIWKLKPVSWKSRFSMNLIFVSRSKTVNSVEVEIFPRILLYNFIQF